MTGPEHSIFAHKTEALRRGFDIRISKREIRLTKDFHLPTRISYRSRRKRKPRIIFCDQGDEIMKRLITLSFLLLLLAGNLHAQSQHKNQERGFNPNSVYSSFNIDHINLFSGNLVLTIPLGNTYPVGGNLSYSFTLVYNSYLWSQREICSNEVNLNFGFFSTWVNLIRQNPDNGTAEYSIEPFVPRTDDPYAPIPSRGVDDGCYTANFPNPAANAGMGWQLTFGRLYKPHEGTPSYNDRFFATEKNEFVFQSADGSEHTFYLTLHEEEPDDANVFYTRDGSYLKLTTFGGVYEIHFPNGVIYTFGPSANGISGETELRVTRMRDQFDNRVDISYTATRWTVTDSLGRLHIVDLGNRGADLPNVVTQVNLQSVKESRANYFFDYSTEIIARASPHVPEGVIPGHNNNVAVPFLTSVTLPDGSQYSMPRDTAYDFTGDESSALVIGIIKKIELPTGASIEWKYRGNSLQDDVTHHYGYPYTSSARNYFRWSTGVRERKVINSGDAYIWKYEPTPERHPEQTPGGQPCNGQTVTAECAPRLFTNKVTAPTGDYTVNYFSTYPHPLDNTAGRDIRNWHVVEYGLPMNKYISTLDAMGQPLFLSTETFNRLGVKLRSTYVRYETDKFPASDGWGNVAETNAREAASRTIYHDDSNRFSEVQNGDFDGLGHYRVTRYFGNFAPADQRLTQTTYNADRGTYFVNPATNAPGAGHTYTLFPGNRPWVLGNYRQASVERAWNGAFQDRSTTFFHFDDNGLLKSKRIMRGFDPAGNSTYALAAQDVVIKYEYDANGNLTSERYHGGYRQAGMTIGNFSAEDAWIDLTTRSLPLREYAISYSYPVCPNGRKIGVIKSSQYIGANFKLVDNDIDYSTGLVEVSRDSSRNETRYFYDGMGRLTNIYRQQGLYTQIQYHPVRPNSTPRNPRVNVFHRANGQFSGPSLDDEEYIYDQLGRLTREKTRMPDGSLSNRDTVYNSMGWKTVVSEWKEETADSSGKKTVFSNFDPFGRPATVTLPDNKIVTTVYRGIRQIDRTVTVGNSLSAAGTINEVGAITSEQYDIHGRLFAVTERSGINNQAIPTYYGYDTNSRLIWTGTTATVPGTLPGTTTDITQGRVFWIDNLGNVTREIHPERGVTQYAGHDSLGKVGTVFDGVHTLRFSYDRNNGGRVTLVEELVSNFLWRPLKEMTYYSTDTGNFSLGKLQSSKRHNYVVNPYSGAEVDALISEDYVYTGLDGRLGNRTTRMATPSAPTFEQTFAYDQFGNLASQTYPKCASSNCTNSPGSQSPVTRVDYLYQKGLLTGVVGYDFANRPRNYAPSITYHINQTVNQVAHGNTLTDTFARDPNYMQRPSSITVTGIGGVVRWASGTYRFDGAGNITKIGNDWYLYDQVNRLTEASVLGAGVRKRYSYDAFGNILKADTYIGVSPSSFVGVLHATFQTGANSTTNRLNVSYDAAGNALGLAGQPPFYSYDSLNMIKTASPGFTYLYGQSEERVYVIDHRSGADKTKYVETWMLRGLNNELLREYTVKSVNGNIGDFIGNWFWAKDYIYRGGQLLASESPSGVLHYHLDHLGTPRMITNAAGFEVERPMNYPFGERITFSSEKLRLTAHEQDQDVMSLYYMHARHYFPHSDHLIAGKFMSIDPGRDFDPREPQSWNLYAYVRNNPINAIDPTGMSGINFGQNLCVAPSPQEAVLAATPTRLRADADTKVAIQLILEEAEAAGLSAAQAAYVLATARHESQLGNSMVEIWGPTKDQSSYEGKASLGNTQAGDGYAYRGRGYAQITGANNYASTGLSLGLGFDLLSTPQNATDPRVAAKALVTGMINGSYTGRRLDRYVNGQQRNFFNARAVINGDKNRRQGKTKIGTVVRRYADSYYQALLKAGWPR